MIARALLWLGLCGALACNRAAGNASSGESPTRSASSDEDETLAQAEQTNAVMWMIAAEAAIEAETDLNRHSGAHPDQGASAPRVGSRLPDVIYVATPDNVVDEMLELAQVREDDVLYDLGCGDGRIVIRAAEQYGIRTWGFDIDPGRVAEARRNAKQAGVEDLVTIEERDIFTLDLSKASVITLYLMSELNLRLVPQLNQMKPGSRIVSHDFDMPGIEPEEHVRLRANNGKTRHDVYLWQTPLVHQSANPAPAPTPAADAQPEAKATDDSEKSQPDARGEECETGNCVAEDAPQTPNR